MRRQLNQKNYIAIADWMLDFDLNTRELLTYAIIYGFSQDGESCFSGSLSYLASWLNISRRDNVLRYLKSLENKGMVRKEKKNNGRNTWCEYRANLDNGVVKDTDHLIILPWMIESGLKDKELILYALIYGFSRKGSNSYFSGTSNYMAMWLGVNKAHLNRYLSVLIKSGFVEITKEKHLTKYRAIIPENSIETEGTHQFEYTLTTTEEDVFTNLSTPITKLSTGITKLSTNNLDNNLSESDVVVMDNASLAAEEKESRIGCSIQRIVDANAIEIMRLNEATRNTELSEKIVRYLCDACDGYGLENTRIINKLPDCDFRKLFLIATDIVCEDPGTEKMNVPISVLKSQISKCIAAYKNTERN